MPFKSDKQRKWMYANEPEMAKKGEKEEAIKGKLRNLIKQEIKSVNEGWWEDLSDKAQAAYIKKHGAAPNSSTPEPIGKYKKGDITKQVQSDKGREIAKKMAGNMTGAVKKIEKIKKGLSDDPKVKAALRKANESVNESRIVGYDKSYLKNAKKRLKVPHEITKIEYKRTPLRSGVQDKFVRIWFKLKWKPGRWFDPEEHWVSVFYDSPERLKMIGKKLKLKLKESVNELEMAPFSTQEARLHIDADIKKMSKELGKASHDIIKMMMDGVKRGRYTPMDISRGIKEGPAKRTHFGELTFIQQLWNKVREKFRRYSKDRKLS